MADIEILTSDLDLEWENLSGSTKSTKVNALLKAVIQRGILKELIDGCIPIV